MFHLAQDAERSQAVAEYETRLSDMVKSLAEYKSRALQAEVGRANGDVHDRELMVHLG